MLPIYKYEKEAGLSNLIQSHSSIILASKAQWVDEDDSNKQTIARFLDSHAVNVNQVDLFYLESILASVGWNGNDDVFDPKELWSARHTPIDKQFNYMHDESDIIGHLVSSRITDTNGNIIEKEEDLPSLFDIVVGSVIYKHWSNPELQERMNQIIADVKECKWFVSMECLFKDFDYAVITPQEENKVIARNDDTSFLTKHLRIYGGTGEYEGHRVGRLIRNFTFSGKGLVDNPANPRSHITKSKVFVDATSATDKLFSKQEKSMSDIPQKEYDALKAKYDALESKLEEIKTSKAEETQKEVEQLKAQISELTEAKTKAENDLSQTKEIAEEKDQNISELKSQVEETQKKLDEAENKLKEQEQESIKARRKTALLEKVDEDKADNLVEKFSNASDEMFDALLESLPAKKDDSKKDDDSNDDDDKDSKEKDDKKKSKSNQDSDVDTDIDDAKASNDASMSDGGDDEQKTISSKASSWLSSNVLRATAGKDNKGE